MTARLDFWFEFSSTYSYPAAMRVEEVASRATQRNPYASREPYVTGSLGGRHVSHRAREKVDEEDEFMDD